MSNPPFYNGGMKDAFNALVGWGVVGEPAAAVTKRQAVRPRYAIPGAARDKVFRHSHHGEGKFEG
jgi:hypothetical protein